jgi:hypothetical protein
MTYLISWLILASCTFCIGKIDTENLFKPYGGLPSVCRKIWLEDPENSYEDIQSLNEMPDGFIAAILYTMFLVLNLMLWPVVLCVIIWVKIFPLDTTELEEYK